MGLINPIELLKKAEEKKVAVAAFNVHNMETIQAVIDGANEEGAPVIIQTTPGTLRYAGIEFIAEIVKIAAEKVDIPVALHIDHCTSYSMIIEAIRSGYTSLMIDGSGLPYEENVKLVKEVVRVAHAVDIAVEAELGKIGGTEDNIKLSDREATFTVPEEAREFVRSTDVDSLAVAIGTAHGIYRGEPKLDFERLSKIKEIVDIPLVLHGASGVPDNSIKEAIKRGIAKVNIATELKIPFADAIMAYFKDNPGGNDPRYYLGAGREAVKRVVQQKIQLCETNLLKR
jgi:tagatose bisphosphate family class II aldolase